MSTTNRARVVLSLALGILAGACGASDKEIRTARTSGYDVDFAIVYSEVLKVVQSKYPQLMENAGRGVIKTAWHPVNFDQGQTDPRSQQARDQLAAQQAGNTLGGGVYQLDRYFIRFDVVISQGKPWRVRVRGQASKWRAGEVPVELRGADEPHWLQGRIDALQVEIHRRLSQYAVEMPEELPVEQGAQVTKVDSAALGDLPPEAATVVAEALSAAKDRDFGRLRAIMADEFTWSLGAGPDADAALAMWQADSSLIQQLVATIEAGCKKDPQSERVVCPAAYLDQPGYLDFRVGFAPAGDSWKMIFFVSGD